MREFRLPMLSAQREIWLAQQIHPRPVAHRIGEYLAVHGAVEVAVFERAVRQVVREAETLRTVFSEMDGVVHQYVRPLPDWSFPVIDCGAAGDPLAEAEARMRAEMSEPMSLEAHRQLLRYQSGQPITSRRYDHLWLRVGDHLPWARTQGVSTHWLRDTTLTWVERHYGPAVARIATSSRTRTPTPQRRRPASPRWRSRR